jgi:hypothetical protein
MGLGKTIQVLSLLLVLKHQTAGQQQPSLLVAPASLLANWASEIERFAPGLKAIVAHPSALPAAALKTVAPERLADIDLVITSYGSLHRMPWIAEAAWQLVVLDEAQAIKNPDAKQTRTVKALKARARFALTGTPIENRLGDLWSIFDFVNPGTVLPDPGDAKLAHTFSQLTTQCHLVFARLRLGVNGGADPWSARDALVPPFLRRNQVLATIEEPARGPAADQERTRGPPHQLCRCALLGKLSGIAASARLVAKTAKVRLL